MLQSYISFKSISELINKDIPLAKIDETLINQSFLFYLYENVDAIDRIMSVDFKKLPKRISGEAWPNSFPNAFPNQPPHIFTTNHLMMLKRYAVFSYLFCKNNVVLDSCSGLGWGSYILSQRAKSVYSLDNSSVSIEFAKLLFSEADNIHHIVDDAISMNNFSNNFNSIGIDIVVATETIEHFNKFDGINYIDSMFSALKSDGILCGTTKLFNSRNEADNSDYYTKINSHLYAWTVEELELELSKYSSEYKIYKNWMFFARKK